MTDNTIDACLPVDISDDDIYEAMRDIPGYLDITLSDFRAVYVRAYQHARARLMSTVKARDVMSRQVVWVSEDAPLWEVAAAMAEKGVSGVPVLDATQSIVGVISEKDFLGAMTTGGPRTFLHVIADCLKGAGCLAAPNRKKRAGDLMNSPAITVSEDAPITVVADIMTRNRVNRAPVVDNRDHLVGIISRADIVRSTSL